MPLGRTQDWRARGRPPGAMVRLPLKALLDDLQAQGRAPPLGPRGWGARRRAKTVAARGWSLVLAAPQAKPVITPTGLTARRS
jgi:hypothetical protein